MSDTNSWMALAIQSPLDLTRAERQFFDDWVTEMHCACLSFIHSVRTNEIPNDEDPYTVSVSIPQVAIDRLR